LPTIISMMALLSVSRAFLVPTVRPSRMTVILSASSNASSSLWEM
jgi:hypothetical protein